MSISLNQDDWLKQFIDLILQQYNIDAAFEAAAELPEENRGFAAVEHSLGRRGVSFGLPKIHAELSAVPDFPPIKFLSTLKHQAELVLDVAVALNRPFDGDYGRLALVMIWWASVNDLDRMTELAEAWQEVMAGNREIEEVVQTLESHFGPLQEALKKRAVLRADPLLALPVNQGISYFEIKITGLFAVALYEDERLQHHEVEQILTQMHQDRIHFVEATIALAWANGILEAEERNLIKKQLEVLKLSKKENRKLIRLMITPSTPKEFAQSFSSPETSMFVLRELVIASMIDGVQDARERKFLYSTSKEFGLSEEQYNTVQNEMRAFLESNRDAIEQMKKYRRARPSLI